MNGTSTLVVVLYSLASYLTFASFLVISLFFLLLSHFRLFKSLFNHANTSNGKICIRKQNKSNVAACERWTKLRIFISSGQFLVLRQYAIIWVENKNRQKYKIENDERNDDCRLLPSTSFNVLIQIFNLQIVEGSQKKKNVEKKQKQLIEIVDDDVFFFCICHQNANIAISCSARLCCHLDSFGLWTQNPVNERTKER